MLITIEKLKEIYTDKDFSKYSDVRLEMKLKSIETAIRRLTHNKFLNRAFKYSHIAKGGKMIVSKQHYLKVDDTVLISGSTFNNGLYVIKEIDNNTFTLDKPLIDDIKGIAIKVEYPIDIIDGAVELLDWDCNYKMADKQGISSESISRHSVSYVQYSESNMKEGYPIEKMGFIKKYTEWRT